jgi:hypothetical protein
MATKKATNKLTPRLETIAVPEAPWISIDIGIWPGAGPGPHLTMMAYYHLKPGQWRPPAARGDAWEAVGRMMRRLWTRHACPTCHGRDGTSCARCDSIGWRRWKRWTAAGKKLDAKGYPVF